MMCFCGRALLKALCVQNVVLRNNPIFALNACFVIYQVWGHPGYVDSLAVALFQPAAKYLFWKFLYAVHTVDKSAEGDHTEFVFLPLDRSLRLYLFQACLPHLRA